MSVKYLSLSILILFWIILECKGEVIVIPGDYPEIQQGIDAAADYDTVLVSPGTYFENLVVLDKNITIGSYFLVDGDTNHISQTIIDGNQAGHVVKIQDVASSILISGLTITNGRSTIGGGFYIVDSEVSLDHIRIINNSSKLLKIEKWENSFIFNG